MTDTLVERDDWRGEHLIRASVKQPEPEAVKKMRPGPSRGPMRHPKEQVAARRKQVRVLIKQGMTASQIGRAVGAPSSTIYKDARFLGLTCRPAKGKGN